MPTVHDLLDKLWHDYAEMNPQAKAIHDLLTSRGERVVNDHIALRTYDDPRVGLDVLARAFVELGYQPRDRYVFTEKKLLARHYEHRDAEMPKVFISELRLGECSEDLRAIVRRLIDQMPAGLPGRWDFPVAGRPWEISQGDYKALRAESEYAAWLGAFGFRANHFTVSVNHLKVFNEVGKLNTFLKGAGFKLNDAGGEIKGSPSVLLEQSSTLADQVEVRFGDGPAVIPGCYYEFARRYPMPDGRLFQGFVEKSADKIFESTDARKRG